MRAGQSSEVLRERKSDQERRHGQQHTLVVFQPRVGLVMLACGTVPLRAGVVALMVVLTLLTGKEVATERLRAALRNVVHSPQMRSRYPVAKPRAVRGAVDAEEVCTLSHHRALIGRHAIMRLIRLRSAFACAVLS